MRRGVFMLLELTYLVRLVCFVPMPEMSSRRGLDEIHLAVIGGFSWICGRIGHWAGAAIHGSARDPKREPTALAGRLRLRISRREAPETARSDRTCSEMVL